MVGEGGGDEGQCVAVLDCDVVEPTIAGAWMDGAVLLVKKESAPGRGR